MVTPAKEKIFTDISTKFKGMAGIILTEYQGLTVSDLNELRKGLRKLDSQYVIVKNTITARALKEASIQELDQDLSGPTALLIINGDEVLAAKKLTDFSRNNEKLKIKSGHLFGKVMSSGEISRIASLPTKDQLLGQFTGVLKMSLCSLVGVLGAPIRDFVGVLNAIKDKAPEKQ